MSHTDRVVVLIDMDCFYCQVEEQLNPNLKDKPIAVVQYNAWRGGGIIAVNYPARDQGVTRHMRGNEAKKKCPSINLVQVPAVRGKADLTKYREAGKRVANVLQTFTPLLERASVDEAYLDITESVRNRLNNGLSDLKITNMLNTYIVGCETQEFLNRIVENPEFSEDNVRLAVGGLITEEIRRKVYEQTGYKCSAGIAHNKILAKLVCSLHKPNKQTIIPQDAVEEYFKTVAIHKIRSLGGKFGKSLVEDLGIENMGQLAQFSEKELMKRYEEKTANWLYKIARGIDLEPVTTKLISKSIGSSKNFPGKQALIKQEEVEHWLSELAQEVSERLHKDLAENNRKAKQVTVSFVQDVGKKEVHSSRSVPLNSYDSKRITQTALEVVRKFCQKSDGNYSIKHLSISAGNFEDNKKIREITSFFKANQSVQPIDKNDESVYSVSTDELEETDDLVFYDDTVASCSKTDQIEKSQTVPSPSCSFFKNYFTVMKTTETSNQPEESEESSSPIEVTSQICPECNKRIEITEMLAHQDYHFALKLMKEENKQNLPVNETKKSLKTNKRKANEMANSSNMLLNFFTKCEQVPDDSELEICPQCTKKIKKDEFSSHLDYHAAKKLHLELNSTTVKPVQIKTNQKKNPSSLMSFLKPL